MRKGLVAAIVWLSLVWPAFADVAQMQSSLRYLGYEPGVADGQYGPKTQSALEEFFRRTNIAFDGSLSDDQVQFVSDYYAFYSRPTEILQGLVTRSIDPSRLSDREICETLVVLPLRVTFEEAEARALTCDLSVELDLNLPKAYSGDAELESYALENMVEIPAFSLRDVEPLYPSVEVTWESFKDYNSLAMASLSFKLNDELSFFNDQLNFCRSWWPTVNHIMPDPSKTLDGTGAWTESSLRDAQVYCQDHLRFFALAALENSPKGNKALNDYRLMVEEWVRNDTPRNLSYDRTGANTNFPYILMINQVTSGVELLRSGFDWNPDQEAAYNSWALRRIDEITPIEVKRPTGSEYCLRPTSTDVEPSDECMNAAALAAQAILRVGIATKSPELVRRAYLTFHRYLSGVRADGSPAFDSLRGCYAADYVAWAAMFSDAFLFQWNRIAEIDWNLSVNGGASIEDMMAYALRVVDMPSDVNYYAKAATFYDECYDSAGELIQNTSIDPMQFFATYLAANRPELLVSAPLQDDLWAYSRGGGPNYEILAMAEFGLSTPPSPRSLRLNWYIELKSDNYRRNLEAEDLIYLEGEASIERIDHFDSSSEGISGRSNMSYTVGPDELGLQGEVTVLGDEKILINIIAPMQQQQAIINFGEGDRLIISW